MSSPLEPIRPAPSDSDGLRLGRAESLRRVQRRERPAEDEGSGGSRHHHEQAREDAEHASIWRADDPHEEPARAAGAYDDHGRLNPIQLAQRDLLRHLDTTA